MVYAVIMAGGKGTRFWPRSTEDKPKQFLNLFGERTMLQDTVERISEYIPLGRNIIVTNEQYRELVHEQLPDIPEENVIGEPVGRDTAPCIAAAATLLNSKEPDSTMIVLPADHLISDPSTFISILKTAVAQARRGKNLVTIGIRPSHPETGYGYIQFDKSTTDELEGNPVHEVKNFTEKPDKETAKKFIDSGDYLWNSGMFIWQTSTILEQMEQHLPEIHDQTEHLQQKVESDQQKEGIDTFYRNCPKISVDYGIMEKASTVYVIPGQFGWNDVGSWRAVYELSEKDDDENVIATDHSMLEDAEHNYIFSESGKMVSVIGMDNIAVVETDDAILVCNLDQSQAVKKVVNKLRDDESMHKFL